MVSSQLNSRLGFINPGLTSMGFEKGLLGSQYLFSAISISQWPLWWRCLNESEGVLDRFFSIGIWVLMVVSCGLAFLKLQLISVDAVLTNGFPPGNNHWMSLEEVFSVGNVGVWVPIWVFQGCLWLGLESSLVLGAPWGRFAQLLGVKMCQGWPWWQK